MIIDHGLITCFPANTKDSSDKLFFCEASGVLYYNKMVYIASDRDYPGTSSIFTVPFSIPFSNYGADMKVIDQPFINNALKWEDMSISPDQQFIFAITGFDRVKKGSHEWDNFNELVYWPANNIDSAKILCETDSGGMKSSLLLRHRISKVLADHDFPDGMPYFKTEGLAILPGNKMLIGIREYGSDYEHFKYAFKILQCTYQVNGNTIERNDDLKAIYNIDSLRIPGNTLPLGLSSMEYDPVTGRIYILTTYEDNNATAPRIGSYIWVLTPDDLYYGNRPTAVRDASGKPLHFTHKAEGITVVNSTTLLVICDDDRYLAPLENNPDLIRQPNQSVYYILALQP
jgi:hypothetical protein